MIIEIRQRNKREFKISEELKEKKAKNKGIEEIIAMLEGVIEFLQDLMVSSPIYRALAGL